MSFSRSRPAQCALVLCAALGLASCNDKPKPKVRDDGTVRPMDGLERFTAQSVSVETAIQAMQDRDLKKLKMLGVWVRNRDKKVLMSKDDLRSLDLAIACLEGQKSADERSAELDEITSGKLKEPTSALCLQEEE